ncbi:MAG: hypothetical protein QUS33_11715 [Dehalococcoidia bacterium]|nr:hypothetical protein [Dehalococcoidia bacterium]
MSVTELLKSARFVVGADGEKQAVILDVAIWEELVTLMEDLEDAEEMQQARQVDEEVVPWERVQAEYRVAHPDADL